LADEEDEESATGPRAGEAGGGGMAEDAVDAAGGVLTGLGAGEASTSNRTTGARGVGARSGSSMGGRAQWCRAVAELVCGALCSWCKQAGGDWEKSWPTTTRASSSSSSRSSQHAPRSPRRSSACSAGCALMCCSCSPRRAEARAPEAVAPSPSLRVSSSLRPARQLYQAIECDSTRLYSAPSVSECLSLASARSRRLGAPAACPSLLSSSPSPPHDSLDSPRPSVRTASKHPLDGLVPSEVVPPPLIWLEAARLSADVLLVLSLRPLASQPPLAQHQQDAQGYVPSLSSSLPTLPLRRADPVLPPPPPHVRPPRSPPLRRSGPRPHLLLSLPPQSISRRDNVSDRSVQLPRPSRARRRAPTARRPGRSSCRGARPSSRRRSPTKCACSL